MIENIRQIINLNCANNRNICKIKSECSNQSHSFMHTMSNRGEYICKNCSSVVCGVCIVHDNIKCIICSYKNYNNEYCKSCNEKHIFMICHSCEKIIRRAKKACNNDYSRTIFNGKHLYCIDCWEKK